MGKKSILVQRLSMYFQEMKEKLKSAVSLFIQLHGLKQPAVLYGFLLIFILFNSSCQKKYLGPELSYGTKFNLLQKMVVTADAGITTHSFTYDANGLVTAYNVLLKGKNPARTENSIYQYYRNSSGAVDSIKIVSSLNGAISNIQKIYFSYSAPGKVDYSIYWHNVNDPNGLRDSSDYRYNGNFLIERLDYIATGSTSFDNTIYRDLVFQYSNNNITNLIFQNTPTGGNPAQKQTTLISYNYDTSRAALPINNFQYGFDSVAFTLQEYAATNNLISIKYGDGASQAGATYEYNYLTVGKPNTANLRVTNANGDAIVSKIEFFYD
jgi:hypothetical protein